MVFYGKVFLLTTFLPSCHLGHLPYSSFCHLLSESRFVIPHIFKLSVFFFFFLETLMLVINDYSISFNSSSSSPNRMTLHSCPRYRPEIVVVLWNKSCKYFCLMAVPLFVPFQIETEKLLAHLVEEEMNKRTVKYCQFLPRPLFGSNKLKFHFVPLIVGYFTRYCNLIGVRVPKSYNPSSLFSKSYLFKDCILLCCFHFMNS